MPGVDDLVLAPERVQEGDERGASRIRCPLLYQCLGDQLAHLPLVAGVLGRPPVGGEEAEGPALLGADHPGPGQPSYSVRRRFLLSGPITVDGVLPWCAITICRAASRTSSPPGRGHGR